MQFVMKLVLATFLLLFLAASVQAADAELEALLDDDFDTDKQVATIADPLEPVNRVFFAFNDRLYFWVLKPVGKVYSAVLADPAVRGCIRAAFDNVLAPVRVVNNALQGKFKQSGTELARFAINTVLGAGGLGDPAAEEFGITQSNEDLGQTLGVYGVGEGIYICWPLFGASSARDTLGMAGDYMLSPLTYALAGETSTSVGLRALKTENEATLRGKDYEDLVSQAFDPYVALRDIYFQHRRSLVADMVMRGGVDKKMAATDKDFTSGQCSDHDREIVVGNLLKARNYQKCIQQMGAQASVNRMHKHGRVHYQVVVDEPPAQAHVARLTDGADNNGEK